MSGWRWGVPVTTFLLLFAVLTSRAAMAASAPGRKLVSPPALPASDGHTDLAGLERAAAGRWDLAREDAVVLLERREIEWTADQRRSETVHRVVRLSTDAVVEEYADLRIAYDSLRTDLEVLSLRTYAGGRWVESGPSAMVETTPFALERAPGLSGIRERMLLHDGVELPCIVETVWRVIDRLPGRGGAEGVFVFPQDAPAALVEFFFTAMSEVGSLESGGGAPGPVAERGPAPGTVRRMVRMELLEPASHGPADPASYLPHVSWSTYGDWASFGSDLRGEFERAVLLDPPLRDSVAALSGEERTAVEKARRLAAFVDERVRLTPCEEALQRPRPRGAARVHASGYGSAFDRAALAAALFREARIAADPVYLGAGYGDVDEGVATLGRMGPLELILREPPDTLHGLPGSGGIIGMYDPAAGTVDFGLAPLSGRSVWVPGRDRRPALRGGASQGVSRLRVELDLSPGDGDSTWSGTGFLDADGIFSPYGRMIGLAREASSSAGEIVASLIAGGGVDACNVSMLQPGRVIAGMQVSVKPGKADGLGRRILTIGDPAGGLNNLLPGDVHLSDQERRAPVDFPRPISQEVRVRILVSADSLVRLPDPVTLKNGVGEFRVEVERKDGRTSIARTLRIDRTRIEAAAWPELRALLLADRSERSRVVLYR